VSGIADDHIAEAIAHLRAIADHDRRAAHALKVLMDGERSDRTQGSWATDVWPPRPGRPPRDDRELIEAAKRIGGVHGIATVARNAREAVKPRSVCRRLQRKMRQFATN
jgi:hypothetical protein